MNIEIKDVLVLDDYQEYVVVSKINYHEKIYYYLIDKKNNRNIKFCYEKEDGLTEIYDNELILKLLPLFIKKAEKEI